MEIWDKRIGPWSSSCRVSLLSGFSPETGEPGGAEARPRSMAAEAPVSGRLGMSDAEGVLGRRFFRPSQDGCILTSRNVLAWAVGGDVVSEYRTRGILAVFDVCPSLVCPAVAVT